MKRILSLLAVTALAITFAAGCGKKTKCDEATTPEDCVTEKFEDKKFVELDCKWVKKGTEASKKEGKCLSGKATAADKKVCEDGKGTAASCLAATDNLKDKNFECKFTAETEANKADQKCEAGLKESL